MTSSTSDAARLVRRALAGDRAAVDNLLAYYRPQLKRMLAVRMDPRLRARIDPSDIAQIVLAEAAQKMVRFSQPPEQFFGWLRQLAWDELARLHRDHIRTHKRSVKLEAHAGVEAADASAVLLADRLAACGLGPRSRMIHEERRNRVRQALAQLAPRDREVLELRFLEQLNITDAAAALGVSEAAVKSRQFRAIERLGQLLGDLRTESEP